ncbi:TPA: hypothetical protein RH266_004251 [Escherichia coli]|nr:hypothetical protein [Escherichia coli]HDV3906636.1 hypothetical protein [Escherichia coli]
MALPRILTAPEDYDPVFFTQAGVNVPPYDDTVCDNPDLLRLFIQSVPGHKKVSVSSFLDGRKIVMEGDKVNLNSTPHRKLKADLMSKIWHYRCVGDIWFDELAVRSWYKAPNVAENALLMAVLGQLVDKGYLLTRPKHLISGDKTVVTAFWYSTSSVYHLTLTNRPVFGHYTYDFFSLPDEWNILDYYDKLTKDKSLSLTPLQGEILYYLTLCAIFVNAGIIPVQYYTRTSNQLSEVFGIGARYLREQCKILYPLGLVDRLQVNNKEYSYGVNTSLFYNADAPELLQKLTFEPDTFTDFFNEFIGVREMPSELFLLGKVDNKELEEAI